MAKKQKFYTVWVGINPGVYDNWEECKRQIDGVKAAKYKSFESEVDAKRAFGEDYSNYYNKKQATVAKVFNNEVYEKQSIAVDAACSGNPGDMEFRGVWVGDNTEIFHRGPFPGGTNNIGEFLALVYILMLQTQKNLNYTIYSDSMTAISWVRKGKCNTKLVPTEGNRKIFEMIAIAEKWLSENRIKHRIVKWNTALWGEIPADFGRK